MALWKAKSSLGPEQKSQALEQESDSKNHQTEGSGPFVGAADAQMQEVFSSSYPVPVRPPSPSPPESPSSALWKRS